MKSEEKKDEDWNERQEGDILHQISELIPGLGDLIRGMEKSEIFQERIREANQELERRLKGTPTGVERRSTIPLPSVLPVRRTVQRRDRSAPLPQKEIVVDVFDEGDFLRVVADIPGVSQSDIQVEVRGETLLLIMISTLVREIKLPVPVDRKPQTELKNNVLQIILKKRRSD